MKCIKYYIQDRTIFIESCEMLEENECGKVNKLNLCIIYEN